MYARLFEHLVRPVAEHYRPELILVSAGFDAHARDPLGGMAVSAEGFAYLMHIVLELANELCSGRCALLLEGGYDLEGLSHSTRACLEVATGARSATAPGPRRAVARPSRHRRQDRRLPPLAGPWLTDRKGRNPGAPVA